MVDFSDVDIGEPPTVDNNPVHLPPGATMMYCASVECPEIGRNFGVFVPAEPQRRHNGWVIVGHDGQGQGVCFAPWDEGVQDIPVGSCEELRQLSLVRGINPDWTPRVAVGEILAALDLTNNPFDQPFKDKMRLLFHLLLAGRT